MKFKIKNPVRFTAIIVGGFICYLVWGPAVWAAFLVGALVGSFKME